MFCFQVHINAALLPELAPPTATVSYGVNLTQPLVEPTGACRPKPYYLISSVLPVPCQRFTFLLLPKCAGACDT